MVRPSFRRLLPVRRYRLRPRSSHRVPALARRGPRPQRIRGKNHAGLEPREAPAVFRWGRVFRVSRNGAGGCCLRPRRRRGPSRNQAAVHILHLQLPDEPRKRKDPRLCPARISRTEAKRLCYRSKPHMRTSGSNSTPDSSNTESRTSPISPRTSSAVAPPVFTTNPACFLDTSAPPTATPCKPAS